jgi:MFS transporter, ACDE family, multidrug resistance protein
MTENVDFHSSRISFSSIFFRNSWIHNMVMAEKNLYLNKNLQIIFFLTLMAVMGVASITPAFPAIVERFDLEYKKIGLLITFFTLPGIILTPFLGILADRFGRKTILVPALFLFALGGFACSQAESYQSLLMFRLIQGIGGASLGSLNVTLIGDIFAKEQRATAMGYNASVLSIGTAAYPAMGGALALLGWNYPFFFPLLAIPAGLLVIFALDLPSNHSGEDFSTYLKQAAKTIARREVLMLFILNILTFIILYGSYLTYIPLVMKERMASNTFIIGLIMSASSLTTALTSARLGKLSKRFSSYDLLKAAYVFYVLSLLIIPFISKDWMMILPAIFSDLPRE